MIVSDPDPDPTCQVITDLDPTYRVISNPDPDRQKVSDPGGSDSVTLLNEVNK